MYWRLPRQQIGIRDIALRNVKLPSEDSMSLFGDEKQFTARRSVRITMTARRGASTSLVIFAL